MPDSAFIQEPVVAALLQNLVLLIVIAAIPDLAFERSNRVRPALLSLMRGGLVGITGIAMMAATLEVAPDVVIDARSVLLSISGLFFGAIPTLVTVAMMTAFRLTAGSPDAMLFGVAVIVSSAGIGLLWNRLRGQARGPYGARELWTFGLVVGLVMVGLLLALPASLEVRAMIAVSVIVIFPPVTAVLGRAIESRGQRRRMEAALIESDKRLRLALDNVEVGTYDLDAVTGEIAFDHRCALMRGYDTPELRLSREEWGERIHPDDQERATSTLRAYLDGALPAYRSEFRVRTAGGDWVWLLSMGLVVDRGAAGSPVRMIGIQVDVSRRHEAEDQLRAAADETARLLDREVRSRRALLSIAEDARASANVLQESEARYRSLVQHSPAAILLFRGDQLTLINDAGLQLFGASRTAELVGRAPGDLFRLPGNAATQVGGHPHATVGLEAMDEVVELQIIRRDGAARDAEMVAAPFVEQGVGYIHVVLQDITERKVAEAEVRRLNADLEARVIARTAELADVNLELESFSSSVSHDLKAPVRAVVSFGELLEGRYGDQLDDRGQRWLNNIVSEGRRMGELIEHLLEYSRLGRSDVRTQPVPLESMLSQLKQTFADRITEVGAVFEVESSAPVLIADPVLLHQILLNLIDNALTYRCPDRTPQVTISAVSEGDTVTVAVTDNGIGIPPEVQAKMFEVFARGHTNAEYPGTGIGLATVRKAARRMGSDVTVDSTVGVGTRFSLRLPIAQNGARHGG